MNVALRKWDFDTGGRFCISVFLTASLVTGLLSVDSARAEYVDKKSKLSVKKKQEFYSLVNRTLVRKQ